MENGVNNSMGKSMRTAPITVGILFIAILAVSLVGVASVQAATTTTSQLSQTIGAGALSTSIRDAGGAVVASPSFTMGAVNVSTGAQTATGTWGSNTQRITVDNPGGANAGWVLSLSATGGASATWTSGGNTYAFNGTTVTGRLTIDPSVSTLTAVTGTSTGITKGTSAAFTAATPITLLTASAASDDIWNGYITGVGVSQAIPASQPAGTYSFDLTQTVVAN